MNKNTKNDSFDTQYPGRYRNRIW